MAQPSHPTREDFTQLVADLRGELAEAARLDAKEADKETGEGGGTRRADLLARQQPVFPAPPEAFKCPGPRMVAAMSRTSTTPPT